MALTQSKPASIFTPEGNSLAVFIDVNDGELKLKDVFGGVQLFSDLAGGGGLKLKDDALMTATLTEVVDKDNTPSVLRISTIDVTNYGGGNINTNTAFGKNSLVANTTGSGNVALGLQALPSNTIGASNVGIGFSALLANTEGASNIGVGTNALNANATGNFNTVVGTQSAIGITTGSNNVVFGTFAIPTLNGSNNTILGYNTGQGITTGSNNTILGANVAGLSSTLNNNVIIADGSGNQRVVIDESGNVGLNNGTSTTQATSVIRSLGTNSGIAIVPNGTGAITADIPDGTATGGNARGTNAIDLQSSRTANTQVASGANSIAIGVNNTSSGSASVALGGSNSASGSFSTISGGTGNSVNKQWDVISGGRDNSVNTPNGYGSIGGGQANVVTSLYGVIAGGSNNTASTGNYATVVGGQSNVSSGQHSISGGFSNVASSEGAVAFGNDNDATNNSASAFGRNATAYLYGQNALGSGFFDVNGTAQASTLVARKFDDLTTGATTILSLDGTGTTNLIIPQGNNRVWNVVASWVAVVIGTSGTTTGVNIGDVITQCNLFAFKKIGGISSIVGSVTNVATHNDASMATASMGYSAGGTQELALTFTAPTFAGGGSVSLRIVNKLMLTEVAYA